MVVGVVARGQFNLTGRRGKLGIRWGKPWRHALTTERLADFERATWLIADYVEVREDLPALIN